MPVVPLPPLPNNPLVGTSPNSNGVTGRSNTAPGVVGESASVDAGAVDGSNSGSGPGVSGTSASGIGVLGISTGGNGVGLRGENTGGGTGVSGSSDTGNAVAGGSNGGNAGYFVGKNGLYAKGTQNAAVFDGNVQVTGTINHTGDMNCSGTLAVAIDVKLGGADCAEDFDVTLCDCSKPGAVMVLNEFGLLQPCTSPYDRRVAGVISGAGSYRPGLILDKTEISETRVPIALMGKVYCQVDADNNAIAVGDLLTTSSTPGHAMKAEDSSKSFGAVIGKALKPLLSGKGLIPILVTLQ